MKPKAPFSSKTPDQWENFYVSLLSQKAKDPMAREIFTMIAGWSSQESSAVEAHWLLSLLGPALCARDAKPFRLIAETIEAQKWRDKKSRAAFPAHFYITLEAWLINPQSKSLPVTLGEFKRAVEKRSGKEIDSGRFYRICAELGIVFRIDPKHGGRPRKRV